MTDLSQNGFNNAGNRQPDRRRDDGPRFAPGFRLSRIDILVLLVGAIGSAAISTLQFWIGAAIAFVVIHFFLFCNIFRLSRSLELAWAAIFVGLAASTTMLSIPGWPATLLLSFVVTCAVVLVEIRKPSYHGVAWQRVNPQLPDWWEANSRRDAESN